MTVKKLIRTILIELIWEKLIPSKLVPASVWTLQNISTWKTVFIDYFFETHVITDWRNLLIYMCICFCCTTFLCCTYDNSAVVEENEL